MHARILCPGPSLAKYSAEGFDGLTIGVNRAATAHLCDVWASNDWQSCLALAPQIVGFPLLLTTTASINSPHMRGFVWPGGIKNADDFAYCLTTYATARMLTMNVAVGFAFITGHTDIAIYGADWSGLLDFDGVAAGTNRNPGRWELEADLFGHLADELRSKGVNVYRVIHEL